MGTISGNLPATGCNDCLRGGRGGDRGQRWGEIFFSPECVPFELVWLKNSPTRKQPHRATCQLDFQKNLSRERHVNGETEAEQGTANLGGQLLCL